jgi:hypothetical protein
MAVTWSLAHAATRAAPVLTRRRRALGQVLVLRSTRRSWTPDSELSAAVWDTTCELNGADNYARGLRVALARPMADPRMSVATRLWACPLYRTRYAPDAPSLSWRLRGRYGWERRSDVGRGASPCGAANTVRSPAWCRNGFRGSLSVRSYGAEMCQ